MILHPGTLWLETIIRGGTAKRMHAYKQLVCADGFAVSVQTGYGMYCSPRPGFPDFGRSSSRVGVSEDYLGPFTAVELGYPTENPGPEFEEFAEDWTRPTETIYSYVPIELVRGLVLRHGGEDEAWTMQCLVEGLDSE